MLIQWSTLARRRVNDLAMKSAYTLSNFTSNTLNHYIYVVLLVEWQTSSTASLTAQLY